MSTLPSSASRLRIRLFRTDVDETGSDSAVTKWSAVYASGRTVPFQPHVGEMLVSTTPTCGRTAAIVTPANSSVAIRPPHHGSFTSDEARDALEYIA